MEEEDLAKELSASFEAGVQRRIQRAKKVNLQRIIPNYWFSAAASDCASMYVDGFFYGAILVAQSYVEALGKFVAEKNKVRQTKDFSKMWWKLVHHKIVSEDVAKAALQIFEDRHDFHHLNKEVETDFQKLESIACAHINRLHLIESSIFGYDIKVPGKISPREPKYWPLKDDGTMAVNLRQGY